MLSPRCILHLVIFMGISILWTSSLISAGSPLVSPVQKARNDKSVPFLEGDLANLAVKPPHSPSPHPSSHPPRHRSKHPPPHSSKHPYPSSHPSPPPSHFPPLLSNPNRMNWRKGTGLVLAAVAGLLQIVVVTYLLVKRKQMLRVVEKYEVWEQTHIQCTPLSPTKFKIGFWGRSQVSWVSVNSLLGLLRACNRMKYV